MLAAPGQGLEHRLRARGTDTEEAIIERLAITKDELEQAEHFEHTLTSQTREADVERLLAIIENVRLARRVAIQTYD